MSVSLAALPVELIDSISRCAANRDLLALSRTNHRLNDVCLRWIYRIVMLDDRVRAVVCFKTLISNIHAARHVRSLLMCVESVLALSR